MKASRQRLSKVLGWTYLVGAAVVLGPYFFLRVITPFWVDVAVISFCFVWLLLGLLFRAVRSKGAK